MINSLHDIDFLELVSFLISLVQNIENFILSIYVCKEKIYKKIISYRKIIESDYYAMDSGVTAMDSNSLSKIARKERG